MTTAATGAPSGPYQRIVEARDQLLGWRGRPEEAAAHFRWPDITGAFNWAVDFFDVMAADNHDCALWIREEDGSHGRLPTPVDFP